MTFEQQKNTKALAITIGAHALLLLFLILFKYTMPAPQQVADLGMEVNLGTSENGYGSEQPEMREDPAAPDATAARAAGMTAAASLKEVHASEDEEAPAVPLAKTVNRRKQPDEHPVNRAAEQAHSDRTVTANRVQKAAQKPKFIYAGSSGKGGNSAQQDKAGGDEGIGSGHGDMGVPGGTPGAANYSGVPGSGNMSYSLNNRVLVQRPDPNARYREGGRVTFNVTVDREGNIIRYSVASAANAAIRAIAIQKLKSVKFNKVPNARPEEFGTITFNFASVNR